MSATQENENIYLSNKSRESQYRHVKFIKADKDFMDLMLSKLKQFLENAEHRQVSLNDFFNQNDTEDLNYFEFRYWVKFHGWKEGIYFSGKSGVDAISLAQIEKIEISQNTCVQNYIDSKHGFIDKSEIAQFIRSKSKCHADLYLKIIIEEKKLLKYNENLFCTPEYFFSNKISEETVINTFQELLSSSYKMLDVSYIQERCNQMWNKKFSYILYFCLANYFKNDIGYNKSISLISMHPIKYRSVGEMVRTYYKLYADKKMVKTKINENVLINEKKLKNHLYRLKKNEQM